MSDTVVSAADRYVMRGGIDPHTRLEMQLALSSWKALATPHPVDRKAENMPIGV